jgi:hypothetical protein
LESFQDDGHPGRPHGFSTTDFLLRVLVDSPAHEFPLRNLRDPIKLLIGRNRISFLPVFNAFEVEQTQILALFPVLIGLFADVDRGRIRDDVRALQQPASIEFTGSPVRTKALGFWVVLIRLQKHEEVLWHSLPTIVFVGEVRRREIEMVTLI